VGVASTRISPELRAQRHASRAGSTYKRFLDDLCEDAGWSSEEAERRALAVIAALEAILPPREAHGLFAQLPSRLRERVAYEPEPERIPPSNAEAFLGRVATVLDVDPDDVDAIVRMVFRALRLHMSSGGARAIEACLPDDLRRLWNPPPFGRR